MIPSRCRARKSLLQTLSKHVGRRRGSDHVSIHYWSFAKHNRPGVLNCLFHARGCLAWGAERGVATNSIATLGKTFVPSREQQAIVELCRTQNVVVSARPGAGKTATAEAIVAADTNRHIAIITYSKRLQLDTARRLEAYPESDVFTFHGLAGRLFSTKVYNDSTLRRLRRERNLPVWTGKPYEIVILDELQDCTDDLFWLICAFISAVTRTACGRAPQIVVLGDERQAIYGFRGADARYLSLSSHAMATLSPYPWTQLALSKTFRLSYENAAFVNNVFLAGEQYIVGSHSGPKPLYLHGDVFKIKAIAHHLVPLIRQYGAENTAILAPSVRNSKPLSSLTNYLSEVHGIPIAVSISDDIPLDDDVLRGKVCVSTYHQFKGNERDLVIVYGVDSSYFDYLARDLPDDRCPNTIFVALTRARKQVVIMHHDENRPMPFIDVAELYKTANLVQFDRDHNDGEMLLECEPPGRTLQLDLLLPTSVSASDLPRHVPDEQIDEICARNVVIKQLLPPLPAAQHINAPAIVLTDAARDHHEAVSDLNGLAVVAAYEHALLGTLTTFGRRGASLLPHFPSSSSTNAQATWLCREACAYEARVSGYKSRKLQMKNHPFNWLGAYLNAARTRLEAQFPQTAILDFEVQLKEQDFHVADPGHGEDQTTSLYGRADIILYEAGASTNSATSSSLSTTTRKKKNKKAASKMDLDNTSIWEIKFVAQLSLNHVVQACIYAYLWAQKHRRQTPPRIILFNVRDGEKWEVVPRAEGVASLRAVVEETLVAKYSIRHTETTEEFLAKCKRAKVEVERGCRSVG